MQKLLPKHIKIKYKENKLKYKTKYLPLAVKGNSIFKIILKKNQNKMSTCYRTSADVAEASTDNWMTVVDYCID